VKRTLSTILIVLFLLVLSLPAAARNTRKTILDAETLSANVPQTIKVSNPKHTRGYLVVVTSNEVATASLIVTTHLIGPNATADALCTSTAITANATTTISYGNIATAEEGVTDSCVFPIADPVSITFLVTGAGASFVVSADLILVDN
jgi:hypothetical protein